MSPAPAAGAQIGVVVLGMSRSGTSAVSEALVASGFFAGTTDTMLPSDRYNPRGYFEQRAIIDLNDEILRELDATWFQPPSRASLEAEDERADYRLRRVFDAFLAQAAERPLLLKEPRIGVMLPLWWPLIAGRLHPVLVVRDPLEVAISLQRRDGTPVPFGLAAWELHTTALLVGLGTNPVTVVHYAELSSSRGAIDALLADVRRSLAPAYAEQLEPRRAPIAVQPGLRRNRAAPGDHSPHLTAEQSELWSWLASLPAGTQALVPPRSLLARDRRAAQALVTAERTRIDAAAVIDGHERRVRTLEKLVGAAEAEQERLRALVHSEQERLTAVLHDERERLSALVHSEQERLTAIIRSEQERLEAELRESHERERELRAELHDAHTAP